MYGCWFVPFYICRLSFIPDKKTTIRQDFSPRNNEKTTVQCNLKSTKFNQKYDKNNPLIATLFVVSFGLAICVVSDAERRQNNRRQKENTIFSLKQCNISFLESDKTVLKVYLAYLTKNYYEPEH